MNNKKEIKKVFHVFFAWQDEKEERWLTQMAKEGWHLCKAGLFTYVFESGAPSQTVYKLDYRVLKSKERVEYESLFRDSGWERVCSFSNWHYFRTPAVVGIDMDIFSDTESRIDKFRRLLYGSIVFIPTNYIVVSRFFRVEESPPSFLHILIMVFWTSITLLWAYAIVRIVIRMRRLKSKALTGTR